MEGTERREKLVELLRESKEPISGSKLAKQLGVSRQVIVQDIALLRAGNTEIMPTTKGYVITEAKEKTFARTFFVRHNTSQIEDELCTIVDCGGKVVDVCVVHPIYGQITTPLVIRSRADVYEFVEQVKQNNTTPLKELTKDQHSHTVQAESQEILMRVEKALKDKKYLIEE